MLVEGISLQEVAGFSSEPRVGGGGSSVAGTVSAYRKENSYLV